MVCDLRPYRVDNPHLSTRQAYKGKLEIVGKVFMICDVPPDAHHVDLWIEKKSGTQWITMAHASTDKTPTKRGEFFFAYFVGCQPGQWRTRARATGNFSGKPFTFQDTSQTAEITAEDCERARKTGTH